MLHHLGSGDGSYSVTANKYVAGGARSVREVKRYRLGAVALDVLPEFLSEMSARAGDAAQEDVKQFNPVQAPRIYGHNSEFRKRNVEAATAYL